MYVFIWRNEQGEYELVDDKGRPVGALTDIVAHNSDMVAVPRSELAAMRAMLQNPLGGHAQVELWHMVGDLLGIARPFGTRDDDDIPF